MPNRTIQGFLKELLAEIVAQRRWFLIPFWLLLAVVAVLLIASGNAHLLPALYIAF